MTTHADHAREPAPEHDPRAAYRQLPEPVRSTETASAPVTAVPPDSPSGLHRDIDQALRAGG